MIDYRQHHRRQIDGGVEYLVDGVPHRLVVRNGVLRCQIGDGRWVRVPPAEASAIAGAGGLEGVAYQPQSALAQRVAAAVRRRLKSETSYALRQRAGVAKSSLRRLLAGGEVMTDVAERLLRACNVEV